LGSYVSLLRSSNLEDEKNQFLFFKKKLLVSKHKIIFRKEIKRRLKSENACYHSVQNPLSSSSLSKNIEIKIYRTINLPVTLYGCETLSLTLREACGPRVFENRVLRRKFGPKRDEVTGKWRKIYNEKINDLYFSRNIFRAIKSRKMLRLEHVAHNWEKRGVYRVLVGVPKGNRSLGRPRYGWDDKIKIDF
jgi:hypothetical protein